MQAGSPSPGVRSALLMVAAAICNGEMIDIASARKLMRFRAAGPTVVSVYAAVPLAPDELRGMAAHLDELLGPMMAEASADGPQPDPDDVAAIRGAILAQAVEWPGQAVAAFACRSLSLFEIIRLPPGIPELAVAASRPHVRPMLAALQRSPGYVLAVIDRRNAWLFRVSAAGIDAVGVLEDDAVRKPRFGGWYGLEEHRVHERITQLTRHHYRRAVAALEHVMKARRSDLLVVAGHQDEIAGFLGVLPQPLRDRVAGSFAVDPHAMTPAKLRSLADAVVTRWQDNRERRLAAETGEIPADDLATRGLEPCLTAASQRAVRSLVVPEQPLVPGFACDRCGGLAAAGAQCPVCGSAMAAVPDVIEELVARVTDEGGVIQFIRNARPEMLAARLRFPLPAR